MMAVYITIRKFRDDQNSVEYTFGLSEEKLGRLRIDKLTGLVALIKAAPGDENGALYERASHKIKKHWAAGEFPDTTCWAS